MAEICSKCGLPKELCICGELTREEEKIKIRSERRRFGKKITIVEGLKGDTKEVKSLLKELKRKLACGGTMKDGTLELQGDHKLKVKEYLLSKGYDEDRVEVI